MAPYLVLIMPAVPLGRLVATPGVMALLTDAAAQTALASCIDRHASGDWGNVCAEDAAANDRAVTQGARVLSAYTLPGDTKIWIITEADRSVTTVLLPEEY